VTERDRSPASAVPLTSGTLPLGDFHPEGGGVIPSAHLHYQILGDPALGGRNGWHLVFHALTGNASVEQWWGDLIGPEAAFDTTRHPVLSVNLLGSCYGSSGPAAVGDGSFPVLTPADLARAHAPLIRHLGIRQLNIVSGGSLGGMVALHWGLVTPVPVERLVVFAAPGRTGAQAIAWNAAQRMAIEADPSWQDGRYLPGEGPRGGLAAARAIAMISYRSAIEFDQRFARRQSRMPGRYDVDHYLRRHGAKLVERFDARSYVSLMGAIDAHDIGNPGVAGWTTRERVREIIGVGVDTDILYAPSEVRSWAEAYARGGANARYEEIETPYGHDAFLIELDQVARILRGR
jgi:homoserine O-acetyltransferase